MRKKLLYGFMFGLLACNAQAQPPHASKSTQLTVTAEEITDRIKGGVLGQMVGDMNGLIHELKYDKEPGVVEKYTPSLLSGANYSDDDLDFEWIHIYEMQKSHQVYLSYKDIKKFWVERVNYRMWWANRYARYLMDLGLEPPYTGSVALNPFAEYNIAGQFMAETYGLMALGMPKTAAKLGVYYTTVSIDYEPAQVAQLFTTMISTTLVEKDLNKILDAGVSALDPKSMVRTLVNDVRDIHRNNPTDWKEARKQFRSKYYKEEWGGVRNTNGIEMNTGAIILAYLYGNGDFSETMRLAFMIGWDADCNAATLGTILGAREGYRSMMSKGWQIVDRFENRTRENMPKDETITSYAERVIEDFEMVNAKNGGKRTIENNRIVFKINGEQPENVMKLVSVDDTRKNLAKNLKKTIVKDLSTGGIQDKARAAYLAISLDLADEIKTLYPVQWKEALYQLDGYWKIRAGMFTGGQIASAVTLRTRFEKQGIHAMPNYVMNKAADEEIYADKNPWRQPELLNSPTRLPVPVPTAKPISAAPPEQ